MNDFILPPEALQRAALLIHGAPRHTCDTNTWGGKPSAVDLQTARIVLENVRRYFPAAGTLAPDGAGAPAAATERPGGCPREGQNATAAPGAAQPPREGVWGRVELPGFRNHCGWVTEATRFGAQVAVVTGDDGREIAVVVFGPGCQFVHLPEPLALTTAGGRGRDDIARELGFQDKVPF